MKRKSVDEFLTYPSKSRRLDYDDSTLLQVTKEEPRILEVLQQQQQQELLLFLSKINKVAVLVPEESALLHYNPANTPFLRSPTSSDFTALLNSHLIPGLKGNSKMASALLHRS